MTQLLSLASELPRYQDNLKQKLDDLQQASQGGVFGKIQESVAELSSNFPKRQFPATGPQEPLAVTSPWPSLLAYVPSFLVFVVDAGLVLVLLLFMLIAYRDLRDRLFRLVGYGRVTVTTKALDEAGRRISRALRMQALVNGTYGSAVGLGRFCLGLPYALMWGLLAGMLRFIPYIGPAVGALLPIALSMAVLALQAAPAALAARPQPPVLSVPYGAGWRPVARGASGTPWGGARQGGRCEWGGPTSGAGPSGSRVAWGGRTRSVAKAV